jgi:hypothetical protein
MNHSNKLKFLGVLACFFAIGQIQAQDRKAPAYPLITHNPNFSIWSATDKLAQSTTTHWTGADHSLLGLIKVDGKIYRFMGKEELKYKAVLGTSDETPYSVKYTETAPQGDWTLASYAADGWKSGAAPIGDNAGMVKTLWKGNDIWVRRVFAITNPSSINELFLKINHDDNIELFLNGKKIYSKIGWTNTIQYYPISKEELKAGENIIAIHLANTAGARFLDFGLADKQKEDADKIQLAEQENVDITATQTIYDFKCGKVDLKLTFTSPLLMMDLALLSRPVSYITYNVRANDSKTHAVKVFLSASSDIAVYRPSQEVTVKKYSTGNLSILKTGTVEQPILQKGADDMRIDWGYFYVAAPKSSGAMQSITSGDDAEDAFKNGSSASTVSRGKSLSLNTVVPFGTVGKTPVERFVELGYDEIYAIQYFKKNLRPWWNTSGKATMEGQLASAANEYKAIMRTCACWLTAKVLLRIPW